MVNTWTMITAVEHTMKTCCCRELCGGPKQQTNFPVSLTFHLSGFFLAQTAFVTSSGFSQFGFSATQRYSSVSSYLQHTALVVIKDWRCLSFLVLKCTEIQTDAQCFNLLSTKKDEWENTSDMLVQQSFGYLCQVFLTAAQWHRTDKWTSVIKMLCSLKMRWMLYSSITMLQLRFKLKSSYVVKKINLFMYVDSC